MATERRIKFLKLRQRNIQTSFDLIKAFVDNYEDDTDACQVPVRLEHLASLWSDFNKVQAELESLDETGIEQQFKHRSSFESAYYKVKGFLLTLNKTPVTPCASGSPYAGHFPPSASHVRLPDVKLPVFSGNLDNWLNFHDLYLSLVHSSAELSNIQKFYYLRSSLSGDALKLIQTIPISANNYVVAWNLLEDHYQNPARLKHTYVDALFEFSTIKRESASELHSLVEKFEANVRVLQQLGEQTQCWDILLIRMLSIRLDPTTRRDWEEYASTKDAISFPDLTAFIQRRVTVLQNMQSNSADIVLASNVKKGNIRPCSKFSKLRLEDKEKEVRRLQLCRNCLRRGHMIKECSSSSTCRKCQGHHHTQLCSTVACDGKLSNSPTSQATSSQTTEQSRLPSVSATLTDLVSHASSSHKSHCVILATAVVILVDEKGNRHPARALLDSGSECCFVTDRLAQSLRVQRKRTFVPVAGIGQSSTNVRQKFLTTIRSRISDYSANVELLVLPKLTVDLPTVSVDSTSWQFPPDIQLADPNFCRSNPVDLILGAEVFFDLFKVTGQISLGNGMPVLINSELGWVVSGRTTTCQRITPVIANVATNVDLHNLMEKFWALEEDYKSPCYSAKEAACEEHFRQTVARTSEGRYIVRLPIKQNILANLSDNRNTAIRRFYALERRLNLDRELGEQYKCFLDEYYALHHMQRVVNPHEITVPCFHLPHHAVVRDSSSTTKVRVVFGASCKSANGPSLNDALLVGPIVQEDLRSIILRSRKHPVMLIADIKQMYRQILLHERDTPLQRIIWRDSSGAPLNTFELKTVTYGASNIDDAKTLQRQLEGLLAKGGFELREWASNEETVLEGIPEENRALQASVDLNFNQCIKTLGIHWEPASDVLRYRINLAMPPTPLTKRVALSQIAQLFDPLGLLGPVVTTAKLFMPSLWMMKNDDGSLWGWDQVLPTSVIERWTNYHSQLPRLNELKHHQQAIAEECNENGIKWHFNPPKASHFGGLWEAAIQSAQKHFIRVLGNHILAHDDMETLLTQIESCLNSRPIVPLTDDPSDNNPLTPGHFLTGCVNCGGDHPTCDRKCTKWMEEGAIVRLKIDRGLSFPEARALMRQSKPESSYAHKVQNRLTPGGDEKDRTIALLKAEVLSLRAQKQSESKDSEIKQLRVALEDAGKQIAEMRQQMQSLKNQLNNTTTQKETPLSTQTNATVTRKPTQQKKKATSPQNGNPTQQNSKTEYQANKKK
ncbi:uncharacterized protein LOC131429022 [Malaya genurostris]|uniref:uncharacterized protein LOC131429022 n=1 Tax=Malaya genurostris TaxID=325434 RepID=UPI0026F3B086|nr:uncharacterized protein LOC131429022 [Malaya genurostris]